jgi:uncharacterized membrane-anchored protein
MDKTTHDERYPTDHKVRITTELRAILATATEADIRSLFQGFRLNLQSRIVAISDDRELHKLQGKLEFVGELENFFLLKS